ncbi:DUF6768 family protein [Phenylobacterium terrae]|uniref:DUF6768 family protein n=1 Tax=Phenylobacterium terrae TaxID=2665495 RepID=A0ABW4MWS3_9CAUL
MSGLDAAIRRTLSEEDARMFEQLDADAALHQQLLETFGGRLRWLNVAGWVAGFVLTGLVFLFGWRFWVAADLAEMLRWGAAAGLAAMGVALIKVWFWLQMQKNAVVRELKRVELQLAMLAAR